SLTNLGMVEIGAESSTNDTSAEDAKTTVSNMDVYGFNPNSPIIDNTRVSGVTHAAITGRPSQNIFSGTGFVANMTGELNSVENEKAFIYVQLGSRGGKLAGGSRSAALSQLRNALSDALNYASRFGGPDDGDALHRRDAAALQDAARGRMPIIIGADRASDLLQIIDLKKEFRLDVIIAGAAEGWMVADDLAAADMRVIVDPVANLPGSFDVVGSRIDNTALMSAAGVELAIMSFSESTSHNVRVLNQHAGNAVANGLSWDQALDAISVTPADWFGVNIGGVAQGSNTFVVWDGDPLQATSAPILIMIDGQEQSLMSRQRELRDRYNPTREDTRAHKYR
ncbi:MAG: amidohydrolase, partial [Hellea sp.]|nr:amidohydrolase [Hellea sp.]